MNYTPEQIARIKRRRQDSRWELASEEEMATMSEEDEKKAIEAMKDDWK